MYNLEEKLDAKEWLALNAKLQTKKRALRAALAKRGVLQKGGKNTFDKYTYFSEAQYKELFTGLMSEAGLELKFNEIEYQLFAGSEKQANGRMPRLEFVLFDTDTGFFERTEITGEGIDKGDKAGYKAYTGALKYYLACTFMVATGDDPEKDSPAETINNTDAEVQKTERTATPRQVEILSRVYTGDNLAKLLEANGVEKLEDITMRKASEIIAYLKASAEKKREAVNNG